MDEEDLKNIEELDFNTEFELEIEHAEDTDLYEEVEKELAYEFNVEVFEFQYDIIEAQYY